MRSGTRREGPTRPGIRCPAVSRGMPSILGSPGGTGEPGPDGAERCRDPPRRGPGAGVELARNPVELPGEVVALGDDDRQIVEQTRAEQAELEHLAAECVGSDFLQPAM